MKFRLSFQILCVLCVSAVRWPAAGAQEPAAKPPKPPSGIMGTAVVGPISPVERPGVPNTRPLPGAIITVEPANEDVSYGTSYFGQIQRLNIKTNELRDVSVGLPNYDGYAARDAIRAILEQYTNNQNWRWRMAARRMMERENVLSLDTVRSLFNRFFRHGQQFTEECKIEPRILYTGEAFEKIGHHRAPDVAESIRRRADLDRTGVRLLHRLDQHLEVARCDDTDDAGVRCRCASPAIEAKFKALHYQFRKRFGGW